MTNTHLSKTTTSSKTSETEFTRNQQTNNVNKGTALNSPFNNTQRLINLLCIKFREMSSTNSTKSTLSKAEIQGLVISSDLSISFIKPAGVRSEFWTNL
ncbi:unnamed protein product [Rotaria sp. Silwood1]|nr:unnamed protein product [Rotaria sp. Silwood1]CAF1581427.1 unnamed protein product [Rotaria sp. Silwood1]CAF1593904.1 unnamed protein product [Rotaria sp. Silwood1]CAF3770450.1 unnamed protein product [Rotaria sp. Silwood1]CAF4924860.1 unnamed protein product [Rotaria sp. Silwood1]